MGKFLKGILILLLIVMLSNVIFEKIYIFPKKITYGVTFSSRYARYLGLDWQKTYYQVLDELKVKNLRISTYWDILEPKPEEYDFSETDYMLKEAEKFGARVILVLGARQPRWPECHIPAWAENLSLQQRRQKTLTFIQKTVERYKNSPAIWAYQVENEPFLPFFGESCDKADKNFLGTEVAVVKSLSDKKIIISDSGELGLWISPMQFSDIFGTTLYRDVYNPIIGYLNYPILPYFYNLKSQVMRTVFAPKNQKTIIVELQAEPWLKDGSLTQNSSAQAKLFPLDKLKNNVTYAQKTGFDESYLWGVEWWYWMDKQGYPQYLDYAKTLFR